MFQEEIPRRPPRHRGSYSRGGTVAVVWERLCFILWINIKVNWICDSVLAENSREPESIGSTIIGFTSESPRTRTLSVREANAWSLLQFQTKPFRQSWRPPLDWQHFKVLYTLFNKWTSEYCLCNPAQKRGGGTFFFSRRPYNLVRKARHDTDKCGSNVRRTTKEG